MLVNLKTVFYKKMPKAFCLDKAILLVYNEGKAVLRVALIKEKGKVI